MSQTVTRRGRSSVGITLLALGAALCPLQAQAGSLSDAEYGRLRGDLWLAMISELDARGIYVDPPSLRTPEGRSSLHERPPSALRGFLGNDADTDAKGVALYALRQLTKGASFNSPIDYETVDLGEIAPWGRPSVVKLTCTYLPSADRISFSKLPRPASPRNVSYHVGFKPKKFTVQPRDKKRPPGFVSDAVTNHHAPR